MSRTLEKYAPYLRLLLKSSSKIRSKLAKKNCSAEFVKCLCECAKNILVGNVSLSPKHKRRLRLHKESLRKLSLKKTPLYKKKKIIQKGGFLGAILGPIIKVLGGLFASS